MNHPWLDRFEQILLVILSGFLFWGNAVSSIAIVSLAILGLIRGGWRAFTNVRGFILLLPFLILLSSWLAFGVPSDGTRELQLWPTWIAAILYFSTSTRPEFFRKSFVLISILQAVAVLTFFTFASPIEHASFSQGFRDAIEAQFHVHPTFVSVAWFWASVLLLLDFKQNIFQRIWGVAFLVVMASLCGGKMPLIACAAILGSMAILKMNSLKYKVATLTGILVLGIGNVLFNPVLTERFEELYRVNLDYEEGQALSSSELRLGIWNCAIETTFDNWIFGVGTGNTRAALEACYEEYDQVEFFDGEYNTHNQFIHFWLASGIAGLLIILLFFSYMLLTAMRLNSRTLVLFLLFFILISLTENYFSRQFGMMFFSLFAANLLFENRHQPSPANNPSS